ncbi:MAG: cyclic nucleotide-binding domain-containing protein [Pseudomonadales bacterium]|nr:cyclic nucleotide-binding domain-containing protein [Pseudomonadales bacterium]
MTVETLDINLLRCFSPLRFLSEQCLEEVVSQIRFIDIAKDKMLFKRDDPRQHCHWLVKGALDLLDENYNAMLLVGGSDSCERMLADKLHYQQTAVAVDDCLLLEIEQDKLDLMLTVDQAAGSDAEGDDWMSKLLQSRLFELIPPANIDTLFKTFSAADYLMGDIIFHQGDKGDYFYVIKAGEVSIERTLKDNSQHLKTAGPGEFFGEDALVRGKPRNATITMQKSGVLMRLNQADFDALLVKPATEYVSETEIQEFIEAGKQPLKLIDVRHPKEIDGQLPHGTIHIPLQVLRSYAAKLDQDTLYVVATPGRRAELGAFLLNQAGFDTFVLKH